MDRCLSQVNIHIRSKWLRQIGFQSLLSTRRKKIASLLSTLCGRNLFPETQNYSWITLSWPASIGMFPSSEEAAKSLSTSLWKRLNLETSSCRSGQKSVVWLAWDPLRALVASNLSKTSFIQVNLLTFGLTVTTLSAVIMSRKWNANYSDRSAAEMPTQENTWPTTS